MTVPEDDADEIPMDGGNASGVVVRVGGTVRKAWADATPSVHDLLRSLRAAGVDVPAPLGRDGRGRQVLEHVPGTIAMHGHPLSRADLARVGAMVRDIHDASAEHAPAPDARWESPIPAEGDDLVCHNDLAPWNLVVGDRWVFIDWDGSAPSTRLWDLAYAAQTFTTADVERDPVDAAARLAAFVDGYRADDSLRSELPAAMVRRAAAMRHLLRSSFVEGHEPWATMHETGHGAHWKSVERYAKANVERWRTALGA